MCRTKCIAIGNRIMMDDGVAVAVVERLKNRLSKFGIKVIIGETDFQFCFNEIEDGDFIIIVDAVCSNKDPCDITVYTLEEVIKEHRKALFQHEISLFDLITMYPKDIKGYMIGIEAAEVGVGFELSTHLRIKFDSICEKVEDTILKIMEDRRHA